MQGIFGDDRQHLSATRLQSEKYWHFIKLMGRSASHIALECAFQTRPNVCLISEEIEAKQMSLGQIIDQVVNSVVVRAEKGENSGVVLIPEGLIEFVPEVKFLIGEIAGGRPSNRPETSASPKKTTAVMSRARSTLSARSCSSRGPESCSTSVPAFARVI